MPIGENNMPAWRGRVREFVAPYRQLVTAAALALMALAVMNATFDWGLLGMHGRKSVGVGLLIGLVWYVFAAPTPNEIQEMRRAKRGI